MPLCLCLFSLPKPSYLIPLKILLKYHLFSLYLSLPHRLNLPPPLFLLHVFCAGLACLTLYLDYMFMCLSPWRLEVLRVQSCMWYTSSKSSASKTWGIATCVRASSFHIFYYWRGKSKKMGKSYWLGPKTSLHAAKSPWALSRLVSKLPQNRRLKENFMPAESWYGIV
jgi:hypothetical protein